MTAHRTADELTTADGRDNEQRRRALELMAAWPATHEQHHTKDHAA